MEKNMQSANEVLGVLILVLPRLLGVTGMYFAQPAADVLTLIVCAASVKKMKATANAKMKE